MPDRRVHELFFQSEKHLEKALQRLWGARSSFHFELAATYRFHCIDEKALADRSDPIQFGRFILAPNRASVSKERKLHFFQDVCLFAKKEKIPLSIQKNSQELSLQTDFISSREALQLDPLILRTLKSVEKKHHLFSLLHERPDLKRRSLGKKLSWRVLNHEGQNLLNPAVNPALFYVLFMAIWHAINDYGDCLASSMVSIYFDETPFTFSFDANGKKLLQGLSINPLNPMLQKKLRKWMGSQLPSKSLPISYQDHQIVINTLGFSQQLYWPMTIFYLIVAESLHRFLDSFEERGIDWRRIFSMIPLPEWSQKVNLNQIERAFSVWKSPQVEYLFRSILSAQEIEKERNGRLSFFVSRIREEALWMVHYFRSTLLQSHSNNQRLKKAGEAIDHLEELVMQSAGLGLDALVKINEELVWKQMEKVRMAVDQLGANKR